jgi:hypothetical protein
MPAFIFRKRRVCRAQRWRPIYPNFARPFASKWYAGAPLVKPYVLGHRHVGRRADPFCRNGRACRAQRWRTISPNFARPFASKWYAGAPLVKPYVLGHRHVRRHTDRFNAQPNNFPGFIRLSGSKAALIARIVSTAEPCSFRRASILPIPIPCSPVQVPPRAKA